MSQTELKARAADRLSLHPPLAPTRPASPTIRYSEPGLTRFPSDRVDLAELRCILVASEKHIERSIIKRGHRFFQILESLQERHLLEVASGLSSPMGRIAVLRHREGSEHLAVNRFRKAPGLPEHWGFPFSCATRPPKKPASEALGVKPAQDWRSRCDAVSYTHLTLPTIYSV